MGLPYVSSNSLNFNLSLGTNVRQSRAIRNNLIQFSRVSWRRLAKAPFKVWLNLSTFPDDWGLQVECKVHFMPRALVIPFVMWDTNPGPLSICRDPGTPNLGIISSSNALTTSVAVSVLAGNASIHLENASTSTEIPEIAWYSRHDSEINLPIFPRICPSGLNGPYLGPFGGLVLELFIVQMGHVSTIWLIILFMPEVTMTSTNLLYRTSLL